MDKNKLIKFIYVLFFILSLTVSACGGGEGGGGEIPPFSLFYSVAVGDLNGDGLLDVAACYTYIAGPPPHPGFVVVYLQDHTKPGTFLPGKIYSVGNDPVSIAIGDLNGDGKLDIVTTNSIASASGVGDSTVSVLLQDPATSGQFLAATNYPTGKNPLSVVIGDLNSDGKPDLAVADSEGISILFQNPALPGTFLPLTAIKGPAASSVAIADLNGDGKDDIVATNVSGVSVMLQDPVIAGSFLAPTNYAAGLQPINVAVGDLNGDGKLDIVVANYGSPSDGSTASVSVLPQNPAAPGSFLTAVNYKADVRSQAVAIADLNGDGKADLAVANSGTLAGACPPNCGSTGTSVSVLLQNPAIPGQLQNATNYPATGDFITWVAIGDMNGDGKSDLVIAQSDGVFIRFQDPLNPGQFFAATAISK